MNRAERVALLVVVASWAVIASPIWALGETHFLRDFWTNYVPARIFAHDALMQGTSPWWTQWLGGGLPTIPDPGNSVFYVPAWPTLVLDSQPWALSLFVSAHLLLAALGTFALARRSVGVWGAAAAALVFGFGGVLISNQINAQWEYGCCWVPWWFWALMGALSTTASPRERARAGLVLALVWALQLLAPDPQTAYLEGLVAGLAALRAARASPERRWWPFALIAGAVTLAALIAAPQVLGFAEALGNTQRTGFSDADATQWSLSAWRFWELVLPLPFGRLTPETTFWATRLVGGTWNNFYFASLYCGATALGFALVGARTWKRHDTLWVGGALFFVLAALGTSVPLYVWLKHSLPLWSAFRYPERLVVLPLLGLAVTIGRGVEQLVTSDARRLKWVLLVPVVGALLALAVPAVVGGAPHTEDIEGIVRGSGLHALGASLACFLIVWGLRAGTARGAALVMVMAIDLLFAAFGAQSTWSPPPSQPVPWAAKGRVLLPLSDVSDAAAKLPPTPSVRRQYDDWISRPNLNQNRGQRTTNAVTSLTLTRTELARQRLGVEAAAALFETELVITRAGVTLPSFTPREELLGGLVVQHAKSQPRAARCSTDWECVGDTELAVASTKAGKLPVERCGAPRVQAGVDVDCAVTRPSSGLIELSLAATTAETAVSVSEAWYPGWQVRFDEGPWVSAAPTRVAIIGAIAPAGTRRLEFRFRPTWLAGSLLISGLAWSGLIFGLWRTRLRIRRTDADLGQARAVSLNLSE